MASFSMIYNPFFIFHSIEKMLPTSPYIMLKHRFPVKSHTVGLRRIRLSLKLFHTLEAFRLHFVVTTIRANKLGKMKTSI